jgi:hypothetical protein
MENKPDEPNVNVEQMDAENYIDIVKKLKENTVSKEDYEKLQEENKKLANTIANGLTVQLKEEQKKAEVDINELRKNFLKENQSNLEYAENVLALRNALMEKNPDDDPFLPKGHNINATEQDKIDAQNVADVLEQCIELADGNSDAFTIALQNRMVDIKLPKRKQ